MTRYLVPPDKNQIQASDREAQPSLHKKQSVQTSIELSPSQNQTELQTSIIRKATENDIGLIYDLYKIVARVDRGSLTQEEDEITPEYIHEVFNDAQERGRILIIEKDRKIIGYLKAFTSEFRCLSHVLTNATLMIHPDWQSQKYGHELIESYLTEIKSNMQHILRFEVLPHQGNKRAIRFYEKHGFVQERLAQKQIRNPGGNFEAEVAMVWFNPNFPEEILRKYHAFLNNLIHKSGKA